MLHIVLGIEKKRKHLALTMKTFNYNNMKPLSKNYISMHFLEISLISRKLTIKRSR